MTQKEEQKKLCDTEYISIAWFKWRELSSLLNNKAIPLKHRTRAYKACIRSTLTYSAATLDSTEREKKAFY